MAEENNIVVLGAGYGGLKVTLKLNELLGNKKNNPLILVNKHKYHMFMTQLHESAAGTSNFDDVTVPLENILRGREVELIKGWVDNIDLQNRIVIANKADVKISFKYLVIALGSEPEYYNIPGLKENSMCLRSFYSSIEIRHCIEKVLKQVTNEPSQQLRNKMLTFVVGGGGLTGVEFAGELAQQLHRVRSKYNIRDNEYKIIVVEGTKELLPGLSNDLAQYTHNTLKQMGVEVITDDFIKKVTPETIYLASERQINYSLLVWAGGIKGNRVLSQSGLRTESRGRVPVNKYLQYVDNPFVYLVGDNAFAKDPKTSKPVLPTAQAALQQGGIVAYNIYADISGQQKKIYQPTAIGTLISIGRGRGLGQIKSFKFKGLAASWLKEIIPLKYRFSLGGFKLLTSDFGSKE